MNRDPDLTLLHFNDGKSHFSISLTNRPKVYHVGALSTEPVGGAARFLTLLNQCRTSNTNTLTLVSGDAFHPSLESAASKGKHMVPILNSLSIDAAVYGNHDFDFGIAQLLKLVHDCNFPWLMSNVFEGSTGKPDLKFRRPR